MLRRSDAEDQEPGGQRQGHRGRRARQLGGGLPRRRGRVEPAGARPPIVRTMASQPDGDALRTVREAIERLRCSERYLYHLFNRGILERVRLGRAVRVRESDLARLVREGVPTEEPAQ